MIVASGCVRTHPHETRCGDAVFVEETSDGLLLAVIDALGHGPLAADVAEQALEAIAACRHERPARIVDACHQRLWRGRGAVMSVIRIDPRGEGVFAGVGNVSARIYPESPRNAVLLPSAGVVGHRYRALREQAFRLPGDGVGMLYSDGISSRVDPLDAKTSIAEAARSLLAAFAKATDDAALIVFAHRGGPRFGEEPTR